MTTLDQSAIADAELTIGKAFGVGGSAWNVQTFLGDGITADQTYATTGTFTGYVISKRQMDPAIAQGVGVLAMQKQWYAVGTSGNLAPKSRLVSVANPSLVFEVGAQDRTVGYVRYLVYPVSA